MTVQGVDERVALQGLVLWPDDVLRRPCAPLLEFGEALEWFAERMTLCRERYRGVGLAAPQLGVPVRIFCWVDSEGRERHAVNPEIDELEGRQVHRESCLSLPGAQVQVRRYTSLRLVARTIKDEPLELRIDDPWEAAVVQHEMSHLHGKLVIHADGATRQMRRNAERKSAAGMERARAAGQRASRRGARR